MKSRLLRRHRPLNRRSAKAHGLVHHPLHGLSKAERNRRLVSLGLSRHDDEALQTAALAIVERFRKWTDRAPCCVTGWRTGEVHELEGQRYQVFVQWAHIQRTRGAYGADFGNAVPLVDLLHRQQEHDAWFFARRGLVAGVLAHAHAVRFFAAHPDDAAWIIQHAADGDVVALATAGLEAR